MLEHKKRDFQMSFFCRLGKDTGRTTLWNTVKNNANEGPGVASKKILIWII
jgi:hypothetical protein